MSVTATSLTPASSGTAYPVRAEGRGLGQEGAPDVPPKREGREVGDSMAAGPGACGDPQGKPDWSVFTTCPFSSIHHPLLGPFWISEAKSSTRGAPGCSCILIFPGGRHALCQPPVRAGDPGSGRRGRAAAVKAPATKANIKDHLQSGELSGCGGSAGSQGRQAGLSLEAAQGAGAKSRNSVLTGSCWPPFSLLPSGQRNTRAVEDLGGGSLGLVC